MAFPVVRGMRGLEFGNPGDMRQWLKALVLEGRKRATADLMSEYIDEGEPVEEPGELLALVDDDAEYLATVRVTQVDAT
ncbi:MAG: ASCH domain-containing protein [Actinomycetota bacterium]|nr:ASCH domain-containing protein [Actinomycetota bacterium]